MRFFTPIEAAGMGHFLLVLRCLFRGLKTGSGFVDLLPPDVSVVGQIFAIIIGCRNFSAFVNFAGCPHGLVDLVYTYICPIGRDLYHGCDLSDHGLRL